MARKNQGLNQANIEAINPRTGNWLRDTKEIILRFLQDLFFQMPQGQFRLVPGGPGKLDYTIDEAESELIVTDQGAWNTDTVGTRPVVIVSRGRLAYGGTSLDQLQGLSFRTGVKKHTDLITGSFVINCMAPNGYEAETIAMIVAAGSNRLRVLLQRAGFFEIGKMVQVGEESPPGSLLSGDSTEDWKNVPVILPFYYQDWWSLGPLNPPVLSGVTLQAQAYGRFLNGLLTVPDVYNPDGSLNESSEGVIVIQSGVPVSG